LNRLYKNWLKWFGMTHIYEIKNIQLPNLFL
jgi:hypothetical protein